MLVVVVVVVVPLALFFFPLCSISHFAQLALLTLVLDILMELGQELV